MIRFPHANNQEIDVTRFVAGWMVWFRLYGGAQRREQWRTSAMPRLNSSECLQNQLAKERIFSLDVLCRFLVRPAYRNTMQATNPFMEKNSRWLLGEQVSNEKTGRHVNGSRLSDEAIARWDALPLAEQSRLEAAIDALNEADLEVGRETLEIVTMPEVEEIISFSDVPAGLHIMNGDDRVALVRKMVSWIQVDPFQPRYRRKDVNKAVVGWGERLKCYFWPNPATDYAATMGQTASFSSRFLPLVTAVEQGQPWSLHEQENALALAEEVLDWGGVRQNKVNAEIVRSVIKNALSGKAVCREAPMNSGWTKIAAFATQHLEEKEGRCPQVIWDSRVATAITHRLDRLCANQPDAPAKLFAAIGKVNGRGGTRPRNLRLNWPIGYRSWASQFAGSLLVQEMKGILNAPGSDYPPMPIPGGGSGPWTSRGVEMVLFMDGY